MKNLLTQWCLIFQVSLVVFEVKSEFTASFFFEGFFRMTPKPTQSSVKDFPETTDIWLKNS